MNTRDLLALPERQLLALVLEVERRPVDWETGTRIEASRQVLERHASLMFAEAGLDVAAAAASLSTSKLLRLDGDAFALTPSGRVVAERCRLEMAANAYGKRLAAFKMSPAYGVYCDRVYGIALAQYSVLDAEQLNALVQALAPARHGVILDVGCGAGRIAGYVAQRTESTVVGIDIAEAAMKQVPGHAQYAVATAETLPFAPRSIAGAYFIDVLNLCGDVGATLARVAEVMTRGAPLCIFNSEVTSGPDGETLALARASSIGRGLSEAGFCWEVRDYSANERAIWSHARRAAKELAGAFEQEGNRSLGAELLREAERGDRWSSEGRLRRLFYIAQTSDAG